MYGPRRIEKGGLRRAAARLRKRAWLTAPVAALALIAVLPQAYGAFSGITANGASNLTTAASFPTYPNSVTGSQFYHRGEDSPSATAFSGAADTSGNARPGVYTDATDGPALWWRLDDGAGTTAADRSGGANPGTLTNGPTWGVGITGTAVTLDGTNDTVVADQAVNTDLSFSVSAWVHPTVGGTTRTILSQDGTTVSAFNLRYDSTGYWKMSMPRTDSTGATIDTATSAIPAPLNQWTHLVGVYDDTADLIRLYVNGVQSGTAAHTVDFAATGAFAAGRGRFSGAANEFFTGRIDEVRAYPQALTLLQVAQLFGTPTLRYEFTNLDATDTSGNNNTGTSYDGPTWSGGYVGLNGSSEYIQSASPAVRTDDSFTVGAWVYLTNVTGLHTIAAAPGASYASFALRSSGATWQFMASNTDAGAPTTTIATSTTAAVAATWTYVAGVYDDADNEMRLYVNGNLEDTVTKSTDWNSTNGLLVGRGQTTDWMNGRIDDVRTWDHPLTTTDMANLDSSLTSHYEMEDGSGTNVTDLSLAGKDATLTGSYSWNSTGHNGDSLSLTGGYATAPAVVDTANSYTVSAWVRLNTITVGNHTILGQDGTTISQFFLQHSNYGGGNTWAFQTEGTDDTSNEYFAESSSTAVAGRWTNVAGVYDDTGNTIKVYVNGVLEGSSAAALDFAATGTFTIGAAKYGGVRADTFPGDIDEVRTWNRALSATEITTLFNRTPSLAWKLDENAGTSLADSSGNGKTGTASNTSWNTGKSNSALSFNGTSSVATTTYSVRTDNSYSVAAWVYLAASGVSRTAVSQDGTNYSAFQLGYDDTGKWVFKTRPSDASPWQDAIGGTPALNTWIHLMGVYDDANDLASLYVNGILTATAAKGTDASAVGSTVIGRARYGGSAAEFWSGRIDEVRTYKRIIDPSEIDDLMGNTEPNTTPGRLHLPSLGVGRVGALDGTQQGMQTSTAVAFSGSSHVYVNTAFAGPNTFSLECWFRASGNAGGNIMGFSSSKTLMTGDTSDRLVFIDSGGKLTFGVAPGGTKTTIRSTATYNDAAWHHVVASLGAGGMLLYVDGALVASDTSVTTAQTIATGYFRWGGTNLTGWANEPTSDYFIGSIDEVAEYATQLTANQVARHYAADH
jgi:hypothetical protein